MPKYVTRFDYEKDGSSTNRLVLIDSYDPNNKYIKGVDLKDSQFKTFFVDNIKNLRFLVIPQSIEYARSLTDNQVMNDIGVTNKNTFNNLYTELIVELYNKMNPNYGLYFVSDNNWLHIEYGHQSSMYLDFVDPTNIKHSVVIDTEKFDIKGITKDGKEVTPKEFLSWLH